MKMLVLFILLFGSFAHADHILIDKQIQITSGLPAWITEIAQKITDQRRNNAVPATGYTECRETAELPDVIFCFADTQQTLALASGRAGTTVEGFLGAKPWELLPFSDPKLQNNLDSTGGTDLKSSDMRQYWDLVTKACAKNSQMCPSPQEAEFFSQVVAKLETRNRPFAVISAAIVSPFGITMAATHEVLHAQYFLNPKYREIVDQFWRQGLTDSKRSQIRAFLSAGYDANNEFLMINEFQAYALQARPSEAFPGFVFRESLTQRLEQAGASPIQVDTGNLP